MMTRQDILEALLKTSEGTREDKILQELLEFAPRPCKKVAHQSEKAANSEKARMMQSADYDGSPLSAYICTTCNMWHLGRSK